MKAPECFAKIVHWVVQRNERNEQNAQGPVATECTGAARQADSDRPELVPDA